MTSDELSKLLRNADASVPAPELAPGLSARVLARSRRRSVAWGVAASVALCVIGALVLNARRGDAGLKNAEAAPNSKLAESNAAIAEIRALQAEANLHAAIAERAVEYERTAFRAEHMNLSAPSRAFRDPASARDEAATTLLVYGDQMRGRQDGVEAERSYRAVLSHFPASVLAATARARLNGMQ